MSTVVMLYKMASTRHCIFYYKMRYPNVKQILDPAILVQIQSGNCLEKAAMKFTGITSLKLVCEGDAQK